MRITDVLGMMQAVYTEWQTVLINPLYVRRENVISWRDYEKRFLAEPVQVSDVIWLQEHHQYTFQVSDDGAIIQMLYVFSDTGRSLREASLGFYRVMAVNEEGLSDDWPNANADDGGYGAMADTEVSWLRVDYDPQAARGAVHNDCHLHICGFPRSRFAVCGVPTPKQFVEFIVALCYPDLYSQHRLDDHHRYTHLARCKERKRIDMTPMDSDVFEVIPHFRIPEF
jgi:hypothetical protein